ncbi:MAG: hypothetical protein ACI9ZH_001847 [Paracoccaceae bacterium]|jgi:hypothetical protein
MSKTSNMPDRDDPDGAAAEAMPSWMPSGGEPAEEDDFGQLDAAEADDAGPKGDDDDDGAQDAPHIAATPQAEGEAIVVLPRQARLPDAEDLVEKLRAFIGAPSLIIDARKVEEITTPVIAALVCAVRSRSEHTPPAAVLAPTAAFVDAFSDLGLFQDLMKMEFRQ